MKNWLKLCFVLIIFALISVITYLILRACGIADIDSLRKLILDSKQYGILTFLLIEILLFVLFCFVPVLNTAIVVLGCILFGAKISFFISWIATIFSSIILFFLGDKFGEKIAIKLIGKKELENAQDLIDSKSKLLLPIVFTFPIFPDDALCIVAGMTKMKFSFFLIITIIFRGIDNLIVCFFGGGFIPWSELSTLDWIILINVIIVDIYLLFKFQKFFENYIKNKKNRNK